MPESTVRNRHRYVFDTVFNNWLGIGYEIVDLFIVERRSGEVYINYAQVTHLDAGVNVWRNGLLEEGRIDNIDPKVDYDENKPFIFGTNTMDGYALPFDLFAMVFYFITRYEEYLDTSYDQYGRHQARNSLAYRHNFLARPIIDEWVEAFRQVLIEKSGVDIQKRKGRRRYSIDIDQPYAFKGKGGKLIPGLIKDTLTARWNTFLSRIVFLATGQDPFDTYDYLSDKLTGKNAEIYFFFLCNYEKPHDLNHVVSMPVWENLIRQIRTYARIGLHPSYASNESGEQLHAEKTIIDKAVMQSVGLSRQHFIKISWPETYRRLIDCGIYEDHSIIYPDAVGYRAGTSKPFKWYDLERDEATDLVIMPYSVMDVTLRYYMKLNPFAAKELVMELRKKSEAVHGDFAFVWHNSSLSTAYGWHPWRSVFEEMIEG